jgi:ubiquinol-cytochrome c reductase cytochrome b subunit
MRYRGWQFKVALTAFAISFVTLGFLGLQPASDTVRDASRFFTGIYFAFFILMPLYTSQERTKPVPERVVYHGHE